MKSIVDRMRTDILPGPNHDKFDYPMSQKHARQPRLDATQMTLNQVRQELVEKYGSSTHDFHE